MALQLIHSRILQETIRTEICLITFWFQGFGVRMFKLFNLIAYNQYKPSK